MSESRVVRLARQFREALLQQELAQMQEMTTRWLQIERVLDLTFTLLAFEVQEIKPPLTQGKLIRLERYRSMLQQVQAELERYNRYAAGRITDAQSYNLAQGVTNAGELITASYPASVLPDFHHIPSTAVEFAVGFAGDGTPLYDLLAESYPTTVQAITQQLVTGLAMGVNPVENARRMRDAFGMALNRALVITRTEQLRPYRYASLAQYQESGVVRGYRRVAAKSTRTCMACLIADGQFYELDVPFEEHPCGRCTPIPVVIGQPEIAWETGKEWFIKQAPAVQRGMMGPGTFTAWQGEQFDLEDIVKRHEDDIWGNSLVPRPLKELQKPLD